MKKTAMLLALFLTTIAWASDPVKDREKEYFKAPDHWELTLGDQKDYIEARVDRYCQARKIKPDSLEYVCGTANSLTKIFKDKYWFKGEIGDEVVMDMARNERESVQVAVIPLKDKLLRGVTLTVGELKNGQGVKLPSGAIQVFNVEYVETTKACYPVAHVGWWPDPLLPAKAVDIPAAETRAFWLEARTGKDIPAGRYEGKITVAATGLSSVVLSLTINVWDITLPSEQVAQTCTWLNAGKCGVKHGKDREKEMYRVYAEYFLDHKINPLELGKQYCTTNDYSAVTENLKWGFEHGLARFEIPRLKGADLKKYCEHLRRQGWFDKAMIYGYKDEPHPRDYEAFRKDSEAIRQVEPKLKIFMAESPVAGLDGAVDVWWSSMPADQPEEIRRQLRAGREVWWYRCGIPVRLEYARPFYEYPSDVLLDRPAIDMRVFYLMMWKFRMTPATFFYCGMQWPSGFEKWPQQPWQTSVTLWNGDGYVVYPGENGPMPSIRLECMVDGIEDYEYLSLLRQAVDKASNAAAADVEAARKLLEVPVELVVSTHYYNKDPKVLLEFRRKVAGMIVKLSRGG
ncbi:MAG: DUF6067 family protein [Verrucomicrobiae bacterium]|nr:DUF6067 family protein [Verrucomicrobiae bacterium]